MEPGAASEFDLHDPIASFGRTWWEVLRRPRGFFASMPDSGGLAAPGAFLLVCLVIMAAASALHGGGIGGFLWRVVAGALWAVGGSAVLVFVSQQLFGGRAGFEATFRTVAYSGAAAVLVWLPLVGPLAALYWALLVALGIERVHGIDIARALLSVAVTSALIGALIAGFRGGHHCPLGPR